MERLEVIGVIVAAALLGAVGNILFKIGTKKWGLITPQRFFDISFSIQYLFTPSIFIALVLFFIGRFLMGSPLSTLGATQVFVSVTILGLVFTMALEALVFHQKYDAWTYIGVVLGLVSIVLISRGVETY
jgi:drug/metabolite transporter (DMT)-like permease